MALSLPRLGVGTWKIGGNWERDMSRRDEEVESIRYALSLGYRLIDTAEAYGNGGAEEIVGVAIEKTKRDDIYLVSKVWKDHLRFDEVLRALDASLERLKTHYLDLYLIHWPNEEVPIEETLGALEKSVSDGTVRAIGVSNFDVPLLEKTLATSKVPVVASQIEYSVVNQEAARDIIPFCKKRGIEVMAYRPLGKGNLGDAPPEIEGVAKKHAATQAQIALSFITSQGITAIPKAGSKEHIRENWESQNINLLEPEIDSLRTV